jgi:hypothetical protein
MVRIKKVMGIDGGDEEDKPKERGPKTMEFKYGRDDVDGKVVVNTMEFKYGRDDVGEAKVELMAALGLSLISLSSRYREPEKSFCLTN